jgi:hypothetical protein
MLFVDKWSLMHWSATRAYSKKERSGKKDASKEIQG